MTMKKIDRSTAPLGTKTALNAAMALHRWRRQNGWKGFDPFGIRAMLYDRFGRGPQALALQTEIARLEKRFLYDRPELFHQLLGDEGYADPKTFANFGTGYLKLYRLLGDAQFLGIARECGDWLITDARQRGDTAWGHPFVWYTEANDYYHPPNNPNIYITSLAAHFLWDLFDATADKTYRDQALTACAFLAAAPRLEDRHGGTCFWYIIDRKELAIHNGNLFVASVLTRSGQPDLIALANKAVTYTLADQNEDGSWYYYGPPRSARMTMIDNYHSGFILEALHHSNRILKRDDVDAAIGKGLAYYRRMFSPHGAPYRLGGEAYPQDIHDAAQGIITFARLKDRHPGHLKIAGTIARWAVEEMQDPDGFFYYRKLAEEAKIRMPYMRWSQAPMFKALTCYLAASGKPHA